MKKKLIILREHILWLFFFLAPFLCGGFQEWTSCLFSFFLIGYLVYCLRVDGGLTIYKNLCLVAISVLALFYGISAFWAVDHGMSFWGFTKFLPLFLCLLVLMQEEKTTRERLLGAIPWSGILMTVLSFALGQIPQFKSVFYVNRRLGGFFQYPNTFALFLLLGVVILAVRETTVYEKNAQELDTSRHFARHRDRQRRVHQEKQIDLGQEKGESGACGKNQRKYWPLFVRGIAMVVLVAGMILSGSRTVFVLLVIVLIALIFLMKNKWRWGLCAFLAAGVAGTAVYAVLAGNVSVISRYLTISTQSSTFLGRLLYFKDALPIILRHPFGLGYLGYYFRQGTFQTGVYSVMNVHNELLQVLLDVGWIPAALLVMMIIRSFFAKGTDWWKRLLILVMVAHSLFDFDFQFVYMGFVLLLLLDISAGERIVYRARAVVYALGAVFAGLSVWVGLGSGFYRMGKAELAVKVYPGCTGAWMDLLTQADTAEEMEEIADTILSYNESVSLAYSAKAKVAYASGNFSEVISYKKEAIALSKYSLEEYLDYFDMLYVGMQLYEQGGDSESAAYVRERLLEIPDMLEEVLAETDALAWKIVDRPELELPEEYEEILEKL